MSTGQDDREWFTYWAEQQYQALTSFLASSPGYGAMRIPERLRDAMEAYKTSQGAGNSMQFCEALQTCWKEIDIPAEQKPALETIVQMSWDGFEH